MVHAKLVARATELGLHSCYYAALEGHESEYVYYKPDRDLQTISDEDLRKEIAEREELFKNAQELGYRDGLIVCDCSDKILPLTTFSNEIIRIKLDAIRKTEKMKKTEESKREAKSKKTASRLT